MFVVHTIKDGKANTTCDFGHVNQFFRENPLFRQVKDEPIFKECVAQGFIYIHAHEPYYTYQKKLDLLMTEVEYNRNTHGY